MRFPRFKGAMRDSFLFCCDFQWAKISPAVFGSLVQGILDPRERRQHGSSYTSERNIMKVIRSVFLDDLHDEWERIKRIVRLAAGLQWRHFIKNCTHSNSSILHAAVAISS